MKAGASERAYQMQKLRSLLLEIPKTEIHLHLEALASVDTIWTLMKKHSISYEEISSKDDLRKKFQVTSLNEFIDLFINVIQNCFRSEDDIDLLIEDARSYLTRNNIVYSEIFFSPSKFLLNGLTFEGIIDRLETGSVSLKKKSSLDIRFIIDVSRSFGMENAMNNLDYTLQNRSDTIIGIGLGGAEATGPAKEYAKVFEKASSEGLHVVAHAGEDVGPESIWDAIKLLGAERIGHGISAIQDDALIDYLEENAVPLEICPTSNLFTQKYVKVLEEHPIRAFYDRGLNVTVNTDDPTLFGIDLVDEYMRLANRGFFKPDEIIDLVKNNVFATFLPKKQKTALWKSAQKIISSYSAELEIA